MTEHSMPEDLRYASDKERRYALAYLRWLAGGTRRQYPPPASNQNYELSSDRAAEIRDDVEQLVRDAAARLES
jgi:hypothetical protein